MVVFYLMVLVAGVGVIYLSIDLIKTGVTVDRKVKGYTGMCAGVLLILYSLLEFLFSKY